MKCPVVESSKYLCDRPGEYQITGTLVCEQHARRWMEAWKLSRMDLTTIDLDHDLGVRDLTDPFTGEMV